MKKIKWTIMSVAICISVGAAIATAPQSDCRTLQQYYATGGGYLPTGGFGQSYVCKAGTGTCTYTFDGVNYWPCRQGTYTLVNLNISSPKPTKK